MTEGLAFIGVEATWTLSRSALPGAPVLPELPECARRRPVVRPRLARVLRWAAERLEPEPLPASWVRV